MKRTTLATLILTTLLIVNCSPQLTVDSVAATATSQPAVTMTPDVKPSETATPLPTVAVDTIEALVAVPSYLRGCRELNPTIYKEQASYNGILPGKTTLFEVRQLVGNPRKISWGKWLFDDFGLAFDEEVVSVISVGNTPTLREMIETYGCPDVLFAYHASVDEPSLETPGTLDVVSFVYSNIGMEFDINHYPVRLSDTVYGLSYYVPMSLHDYIYNESLRNYLQQPDAAKLVSWDEAVED